MMHKRLLAAALFAASAFAQIVPVTDKMLENPDPADWLMWRRTLNSWGYSPLNQINKSNVGTLRMVWTRGMTAGIQEATPLVHGGVMYLPNPANVLQALNAATGDLSLGIQTPRSRRHRPLVRRSPAQEPQHRHLRRQNHRPRRRRFRLRRRRRQRQTSLGNPHPGLPRALRPTNLRPHHRPR